MIAEWKLLLNERGVFVDPNRDRLQVEAILHLLYRNRHIGVKSLNEVEGRGENSRAQRKDDDDKTTRRDSKLTALTDENMNANVAQRQERLRNRSERERQITPPPSEENSSSESEEERDKSRARKEVERRTNESNPTPPHTSERGSGINGMIRAFQDLPRYAGRFQDNLEESIEAFETIADVCDVTTDAQKQKALPIMLKGPAFRQFSRNKNEIVSYDDGLTKLRKWYGSKEKQTRLLREWNLMKLTEAMSLEPEKSELDVFKSFVDKMMALQQQLHSSYHGDRQLRDRIMNSVDIARIQDALTDRPPRTTQQLIERIATKLSHRPKTAGASSAYMSHEAPDRNRYDGEDQAMYTLGQRYHGDATRRLKHYGPKRGGRYRREDGGNKHAGRKLNWKKRGPPWWLKGVKGCLVCHEEGHMAAEKHSREEVSAAIKRLKLKNSAAMLTQEDEAFISQLYEEIDGDGERSQLEVNWNEERDTDSDSDETVYLTISDLTHIEETLANNSFMHNIPIANAECSTAMITASNLTTEGHEVFKGVKLDTCANRTSVMGRSQYSAYCQSFGIKPAIRKGDAKAVRGIGGSQRGI